MTTRTDAAPLIGAGLDVGRMPAHWLMARLGKRVLRPGGRETTRWLLHHAAIGPDDDVIELAPGLGHTATSILSRRPRSYTGVDRDEAAGRTAALALARAGFPDARVLHADAGAVPLDDGSATVIVGEAMLSMQTAASKQAILSEAFRLLRPDGRYVIHELALTPEAGEPVRRARVQAALSAAIHVGVRIGTVHDWATWLEEAGFEIQDVMQAPMRLLELDRLIADEGIPGTARFVANVIRTPGAARRLREVRRVFRAHRFDLCAVGLIARKPEAQAARPGTGA
jgi:ubiquinone/menaquinone biosynthesis C-methylase UbiE